MRVVIWFAIGLLIGLTFATAIGYCVNRNIHQDAIDMGCARHNPVTGNFEWRCDP